RGGLARPERQEGEAEKLEARVLAGEIGQDAGENSQRRKDQDRPALRCAGASVPAAALGWASTDVSMVGAVAGVVGIESGVVSGVINLESSGVEAPDWRPRHDKRYHEA
ncbi:MAG TPA: hypothetical protein VNT30_19970, partial [Stellaceae bacterium]|nr:hypothetical protein [Stellaceae bacterium]